jgi:hypothetical protein
MGMLVGIGADAPAGRLGRVGALGWGRAGERRGDGHDPGRAKGEDRMNTVATDDNQAILDAQMSEHDHQVRLIAQVRAYQDTYPALRNILAIPNAGKRNPAAARWYLDEGMSAGAPDILVLWAGEYLVFGHLGLVYGLAIEMKVKPNQQSAAQVEWQRRLIRGGYGYAVCWNWREAWWTICAYLGLPDAVRSG